MPLKLVFLAASLLLPVCSDGATRKNLSSVCTFVNGPQAGMTLKYDKLPPIPVGSPCVNEFGSLGFIVSAEFEGKGPPMYAGYSEVGARVTGYAPLLERHDEEPGYGLYSYALLTRTPDAADVPRVRAFFEAFLAFPSAQKVSGYLPKKRINITYFPVTSAFPKDWADESVESKATFLLTKYDYARSAAILASLPQRTGASPVIISVLAPANPSQHPHPVLVQDLSTAQSALMAGYASNFANQVSKDQFWEEDSLATLGIGLRNFLETAANGLGMSKDAVRSWVDFLK